jgi:hypothetical protein
MDIFLSEVLIMGDPLTVACKPGFNFSAPFLQAQSFYCATLLKGVGARL